MSGLELSGDRREVEEVTLQEEGLGLPSCGQGLQVHRLGSVLGWKGPAIDICPGSGPRPQLYPQESHDWSIKTEIIRNALAQKILPLAL